MGCIVTNLTVRTWRQKKLIIVQTDPIFLLLTSIFTTHASVILFIGGGGMRAMHNSPGMHPPCHGNACPPGMHPPWACMPPCHTCPLPCMPPPRGYYEMRSMSGGYASYWNALLLFEIKIKTSLKFTLYLKFSMQMFITTLLIFI